MIIDIKNYGSGGSGSGSTVYWNQIVTGGTKIATVTIDDVPTNVFAPEGGDYLPLSGGTITGDIQMGEASNPTAKKIDFNRVVNGVLHTARFSIQNDGSVLFKHLTSGTEDAYLVVDGTGARVGYSGTNGTAVTTDTTRRVVDSKTLNTIWKGTQAEYDALATKDDKTFYIIVE